MYVLAATDGADRVLVTLLLCYAGLLAALYLVALLAGTYTAVRRWVRRRRIRRHGDPRHRGQRHCWLRLRPHRWSYRWRDGTRVHQHARGCTNCGATEW